MPIGQSDPFSTRHPVERPRIHRQSEARGDLALRIVHGQMARAEHIAEPRVDHHAHRLLTSPILLCSTVQMADLIVVLDAGRIVEQGSHEQLMRRDGLYAELYRLQSRAYR